MYFVSKVIWINCNISEITRNKNKCLIIFVIYIDQKIIVKKAVTAIKKTFVHMSTSDSKNWQMHFSIMENKSFNHWY